MFRKRWFGPEIFASPPLSYTYGRTMGDAAGNYDLKVEFLESNDFIDEEDEFRNFCLNLLEPGQIDPNLSPRANVMFAMEATKPNASSAVTDRSGSQFFKTDAVPTSIKRVKPAYVQSLRPESSSVSDDDIRLSYAKLLFNAFNGLEKKELSQELRALCVDDPSMSVKWIGDKGNPCGPDYREASGLTPVISWLEAIMVTAVPDAVIQLQDSKLRVRPDKSSYLLCKYTFNGTQISKIESVGSDALLGHNAALTSGAVSSVTGVSQPKSEDTEVKKNQAVYERSVNRSDSVSSTSSSKGRKRALEPPSVPTDTVDKSTLEATTFLQTTFKMSIVGTLIIHINPEKRIHRFEYIQKLIKLTVGTQ